MATIRKLVRRIPFARTLARMAKVNNVDIYRQKVTSPAHNDVILTSDGIPVPPIRLRDMVHRGGAIMAEDFILEGRRVHQSLLQVASETGSPIEASTRLLEFGVGCGRVARHFLVGKAKNFTGCDVDAELINWCVENLLHSRSARFFRNDYLPPLPIASQSQDLVYAISVFTHMNESAQKSWAHEMGRIVRPGGRFLVSFLERSVTEIPTGVGVHERIDPDYSRTWFGRDGAPDTYYNTYNTSDYMKSVFAESFDLLAYRENVVRNTQSMLVFRKR